jgi:2-phospho-L-lactate guanylyltransferase
MGPMSERPASTADTGRPTWRMVLPVKAAQDAKTRLRVPVGVSRPQLARAMALDTLDAVLACAVVAEVVVVTPDPAVAAAAKTAGAIVVGDHGTGLGAAVEQGADAAAALGPGPIAVLLADVPTLRAADLELALRACAEHAAAYVPDAEGTGTVLLAARERGLLRPQFGADSARRHSAYAVRLDLDLPRLRRDVDVESAMLTAVALGVGRRTTAALHRTG